MGNIVDNIENMNRRTKMILSVVGICAVIVPALLLWFLSSNSKQEPQINNIKRSVDAANVQMSSQSKPISTPFVVAYTPTSETTSSATVNQGTSSAR